MDTLKKFWSWLIVQPVVSKVLFLIAAALAAAAVLFFSSCSTVSQYIPDISDNKLGAEGVVSKEKNITKQTKWYFKPEESLNDSINVSSN